MEDVEVTIFFFAKSRDLLGQNKGVVKVPRETTSSNLFALIHSAFPRLKELQGCFALSVNEEYVSVSEDIPLKFVSSDTIAVIPPLSGG